MPALRDRAVAAARGQARFDVLLTGLVADVLLTGGLVADVLLTGGLAADVATAELRPADPGLRGPLIASVHPPSVHPTSVHPPGLQPDATRTIPLAGAVIAPALSTRISTSRAR